VERKEVKKVNGKTVLSSMIVFLMLLAVAPLIATPTGGIFAAASPVPATTTLTSSNAQQFGWFGASVAVNSKFVVVGAPKEDANGFIEAGHVYVFNAANNKLISTLTSPNAQTYGSFGGSVAVNSKFIVVAAPAEAANGYQHAGNAYVFNAANNKLISTLTSPNARTGGYFGYSVAVSSNIVVVGANNEAANGYLYAGNVYVFNAANGNLISTHTSPNAQTWGYFGYSVAVNSNIVVIGADQEAANGYGQAGNAYIVPA
jgi:outer membrane protein assembly factor BamB